MPRKSLVDIDPRLRSVTEDFEATSIVKRDMAQDAYDAQDKETQAVIDRITATLQQHATGYITPKIQGSVVPVRVDNEYLGYNLFYLAVEIVKDLAFVGIRVAKFEFPQSLCASCSAEVIPEKRKAKKRG